MAASLKVGVATLGDGAGGSTLGGPSPGLVALAGDGVRPWRLWQGLWCGRYSGACPGEMAPLEVGAQGCCVVRLGAGGVPFGG